MIPLTPSELAGPLDGSLRGLSWAVVVLATGLVVIRYSTQPREASRAAVRDCASNDPVYRRPPMKNAGVPVTPLAAPLSTSRCTRAACAPRIELGGNAL